MKFLDTMCLICNVCVAALCLGCNAANDQYISDATTNNVMHKWDSLGWVAYCVREYFYDNGSLPDSYDVIRVRATTLPVIHRPDPEWDYRWYIRPRTRRPNAYETEKELVVQLLQDSMVVVEDARDFYDGDPVNWKDPYWKITEDGKRILGENEENVADAIAECVERTYVSAGRRWPSAIDELRGEDDWPAILRAIGIRRFSIQCPTDSNQSSFFVVASDSGFAYKYTLWSRSVERVTWPHNVRGGK